MFRKIIKYIRPLLLLFLFNGCEHNNEFFEDATATFSNTNNFKVKTVSTKQLSKITKFLETETNVSLFQKDTIAGAIFDTDNIIEVIDNLNTTNYSFRFVYPDTPEHVFYNLVVGINAQGDYNTPYVLKYECDASQLQTFIASNYNFHYFKGSISYHRFTDFFQSDDLFSKTTTDCTQFDQYGDPLACEETSIDGSGPSGSGGSTEVGVGTNGGTVPGTGSPGGNGGFSITVYHIIPVTEIWYVFGPGSVCQHPGECEIVIAMNGQDEQQRTATECPPCTLPTGGVGVSTTYPLAVNQLHLTLSGSLSDAQLDWLEANPDITQQFNDFIAEQSFSEEAKAFTSELLDIVSVDPLADTNALGFVLEAKKQDRIYNDIDEGFLLSINQFTQIDLANPENIDPIVTQFIMKCAALKALHPDWSNLKIFWEASKEVVHISLDVFGLVPVVGELADIANGVLYVIEGDGVNATLSLASAVPFAGWAAQGTKYGLKITNAASDINSKVKLVWKIGNNGVEFGSDSYCRKQLRRVLGLAVGVAEQGHHIIPLAFKSHPLVQKAAKSGSAFHMNEALNGIPLPSTNHLTGHNLYNTKIENIFTGLDEIYPNMDVDNAYNHINALVNQITDLIIANPNMNLGEISNLINYP